jgi:hypothetical protein
VVFVRKHRDHLRKRQIRILHAQRCQAGRRVHIRGHDHGPGAGGLEFGPILRVGQKCQLVWPGFVKPGHARDHHGVGAGRVTAGRVTASRVTASRVTASRVTASRVTADDDAVDARG